MTGQDQNLQVLTDHLHELAALQHTAADKITGANRQIGDVAGKVLSTHGLVCALTSLALTTIDTDRQAVGGLLFKVSTELEEKLDTAATDYNNTDYLAGRSLGWACRV
jgi:hypothetical protein